MTNRRTRSRVLVASVAAAAIVLAALPIGASALTRTGSGTDAAGDAEAIYDMQQASARYKTKGKRASAQVKVSLAAAPQAPGLIAAVIGSHKADDCFAGNVLVLGYSATKDKGFAFIGKKLSDAKATVNGSTVTISIKSPKIADKPWDCASFAAGPEDADIGSDLWETPLRLR
jgi:hypothetical protein